MPCSSSAGHQIAAKGTAKATRHKHGEMGFRFRNDGGAVQFALTRPETDSMSGADLSLT